MKIENGKWKIENDVKMGNILFWLNVPCRYWSFSSNSFRNSLWENDLSGLTMFPKYWSNRNSSSDIRL